MSCECRSGERSLVILARGLEARFPELLRFEPGDGWEALPELDAVRVTVGPEQRWPTLGDVVGFLRSVLGPERLGQLRAAWVPPHTSIEASMKELVHAEPLADMGCAAAGQLLPMLEARRLETWYQPIFRAQDLSVWGYECLVRGRDEAGELVFPGKLLDWAQRERLTFMFDRVCREVHLANAGRANLPEGVHVLINFLPTAIYEPAFCLKTTMAVAREVNLDPGRIIFEVVETDQVNDREHLASILGYYRRHGFKVALDDIGAGHSGLMMLADLNPDLIKIDRELVERASRSSIHQSICRSLVEIGHSQDKLVLAEGVETAEERTLLEQMGIDLFQGYHFARPAPDPVREPAAEALR